MIISKDFELVDPINGEDIITIDDNVVYTISINPEKLQSRVIQEQSINSAKDPHDFLRAHMYSIVDKILDKINTNQ